MSHPFLFLSVVLAIPGALAYLVRGDLRASIRFAVALALPFALTEPLFYPEYWRPRFLFDLARHIGFGIEDVVFVAALAAVAVASFPIAAQRTVEPIAGVDHDARAIASRLAPPLLAVAALVIVAGLAGIPMIYGALIAMIGGSALPLRGRPDLALPALGGALATTFVYGGACLVLAWVDPQVFHVVWRTRELSAVFVLGVPLEELLYAAASGFAASIVVPHARGERLVVRERAAIVRGCAPAPRSRGGLGNGG